MLQSDGRDPAQFSGRVILNSGALLGEAAEMRRYLDWALESQAGWDDQARLNAYARQFPERITAPLLTSSRMLTFDRLDLDRFPLDDRGYVMNCDGALYVLIHRVDSCIGKKCLKVPVMGARLSSGVRKLGKGNFINDVGCEAKGQALSRGQASTHNARRPRSTLCTPILPSPSFRAAVVWPAPVEPR